MVDEIGSAIDPFFRLFSVVVKWQRAEKKWTDGAFLDLDSEVIDVEVDDYWRELYKIQKFFNNKFKKLQVGRTIAIKAIKHTKWDIISKIYTSPFLIFVQSST